MMLIANSDTRDASETTLTGAVAIVTGAAGSGIGAGIADELSRRGVRLVVADLDPFGIEEKARVIHETGGEAIAVAADISDETARQSLVDTAVDRFGGIDIVVNSAAAVMPAPLESIDLDTWRKVYSVNVEGILDLCRKALPHLRESPRAAIVNIGALGGVHGRENSGAYGSSKAALINLTYQLAMEWGPDGVRVNVVNPGTIDTPLSSKTLSAETKASRALAIPLRRLGRPEDLATMVAFLASPAASYVTAQSIDVDGGMGRTVMSTPMLG